MRPWVFQVAQLPPRVSACLSALARAVMPCGARHALVDPVVGFGHKVGSRLATHVLVARDACDAEHQRSALVLDQLPVFVGESSNLCVEVGLNAVDYGH